MRDDARYLFDELTTKALPFVIISAVAARRRSSSWCATPTTGLDLLAIVAVASIVIGWGVAQWPYILPETLEVEDAAAPSGTLSALLVAAICAVVIVVPGFILLYTLDQKSLLPDEGVD